MEKLQKALKKARTERGGVPPKNRRTPSPVPDQTARPQAADISIWDTLAPYDPKPTVLQSNRVITLNPQAEAHPFDVLRTKIFLLMRQHGWTRLAITSPYKGCGKTTTACNLAAGFSRQRNVKSMLFDLDLRRPAISNMLGYKPKHDIKSLLLEDVTAQEQIVRLRTNVALSMAVQSVHDPSQLLLSPKTDSVFDQLQTDFAPDIMMFDLPPMLITDDARAVLQTVDCALIIARAEQTSISQLDVCEREVGELTNVLGVVLNDCRYKDTDNQYNGEYG